jgi:cytochrome c biogenesis protein CcdA
MAITTALVTGMLVGVRHSLEADHIAAISTLVNDEKTDRPGIVGASWGLGHSVPVIGAGLLFVLLSRTLPASVTALFEVLAGAILVYLGARMLVRSTGFVEVDSHTHDGHSHTHVTLGRFSVGSFHTHVDEESVLVGVVHGLAGSGAIVVTLAASAPTVVSSLTLLASFSVITILTMSVLSHLWGSVLTSRLETHLKLVAGTASVVVGSLLLATEVGGLTQHVL